MTIAPSDLEWQFRRHGSATVVFHGVSWRLERVATGYSATTTIPALGGPVSVTTRTIDGALRACEAVGKVEGAPEGKEPTT
jgi:hypothetical protein